MKRARHSISRSRTADRASAPASQRPNMIEGEQLGRAPSQQRSRLKRDALLHAAVDLFARHGYEATAIEDIARRAHTSVGAFYQYFRSKRQILLVLMNELLEKLERVDMQPQGAADLRSAIQSVLRAGLAADLEYAGAYRAWREAMLSDAELAALDERVRSWTTGRLRAVFGMLAQLPGARKDVDVSLFAALMDRLFWDLLASPLRSDPRLVEIVAHTIHSSLFRDSDPPHS
jgi:AcrR family transcriptional regulator